MALATMTSKGQITVPLVVRQALGLRPGAKVDFIALDDGFKVVSLKSDVSNLRGRFAGRVAQAVTLDEMDAAIADAARRPPATQRTLTALLATVSR